MHSSQIFSPEHVHLYERGEKKDEAMYTHN